MSKESHIKIEISKESMKVILTVVIILLIGGSYLAYSNNQYNKQVQADNDARDRQQKAQVAKEEKNRKAEENAQKTLLLSCLVTAEDAWNSYLDLNADSSHVDEEGKTIYYAKVTTFDRANKQQSADNDECYRLYK